MSIVLPQSGAIDYGNPVSDHPLNRGLVSWWLPLPQWSGGSRLFDLTRRNDGTLTNGPTWVPGQNGFGELNHATASNQYVDLGAPTGGTGLDVSGTTPFAVAATVVPASSHNGQVFTRDDNTLGRNFTLDLTSAGDWRFYVNGGGGGALASWTDTSFGARRRLVGVFDGSSVRIYVDGVLRQTSGSGISVSAGTGNIQIGRRTFSGNTEPFNGRIGAAAFWRGANSWGALAAADYEEYRRGYPTALRRVRPWSFGVSAPTTTTTVYKFNRGNAVDLGSPVETEHPLNRGLVGWWLPLPNNSGGSRLFDIKGGNHGTLTNGPTWVPGPNGFGAVRCDGTNDYVALPTATEATGASPRTYGGWFRCDVNNAASGFDIGLYRTGSGSSNNGVSLTLRNSSGTLSTTVDVYGTGTVIGSAITLGQWFWSAFTYDGTNVRLYFNGREVGTSISRTLSTTASAPDLGSDAHYAPGVEYLNGAVGEAFAYPTRCLSASEIAALYDESRRGYPTTLRRVRPWYFGTTAAGGGTSVPVFVHHLRMQGIT